MCLNSRVYSDLMFREDVPVNDQPEAWLLKLILWRFVQARGAAGTIEQPRV